ncbi:MAG: ketopantoate reductase family protein [Gammaproteobacteria bacterium]|nr:ketopantoate reductase family protein [Gammaproteobacteria bacterium]
MRMMMLGAGAVGGYFGGRMVEAGSDISFLVREGRAAQLRDGLRIESPRGDARIPIRTLTAGAPSESFDVVALACKAYGLQGAMQAIAPFVHAGTVILPLLNGYAHLEALEQRFPQATVWGATAGIAATLTADGIVKQMHPNQIITAGLRNGQSATEPLLKQVIAELSRAEIQAVISRDIAIGMWEKWTFLTTLAGVTCLTCGAISQILATDHGEELIAGMFDECCRTAAAEGFPPSASPAQDYRGMLFDRNLALTASMLRDMQAGGPTEADHIIGDMIRRAARHGIDTPYLNTALTRLQVHEAAR